jgi:diketogulonate reductase-like aldo/keto reductase
VERLKENMAIFDFTLSDAEMAEIGKLAHRGGRVVNLAFSPTWD